MRSASRRLVAILGRFLQITRSLVVLRELPVGVRHRNGIGREFLLEFLIHRQTLLCVLLVIDCVEGLVFGSPCGDYDFIHLRVEQRCRRKQNREQH